MIFSVEKEGQVFQTEYVPDRVFPGFSGKKAILSVCRRNVRVHLPTQQGQQKERRLERNGTGMSVCFLKNGNGLGGCFTLLPVDSLLNAVGSV